MTTTNDFLVQQIKDMIKSKIPKTQINAELGVSMAKINEIESFMFANEEITEEDINKPSEKDLEIIAMYNDPSSPKISKIIQKFEISRPTLYNILDRNNIPTRSSKPAYEIARQRQMDEAIQMYLDGHKISVIVEETGIHQPTLHAEIANRPDVKLRRPRKKEDN